MVRENQRESMMSALLDDNDDDKLKVLNYKFCCLAKYILRMWWDASSVMSFDSLEVSSFFSIIPPW